jgi:hypothetical protein
MRSLLALGALAIASVASAADCFDFSGLEEAQRERAETLLLAALDSQALYTFVGIKPMSSGFASVRVPVTGTSPEETALALEEAEELRKILDTFVCGDQLSASLLPFAETFEGQRSLDAYLFAHPTFNQSVKTHQGFWTFYGVTPSTPPAEVVLTFEPDPTVQRFRAFGLLYGYPEFAVDFFVEAELMRRKTGEFVEREFFQIPSFEREEGAYVYAVPPGHRTTTAELELRATCEQVLDYYRELRERFIGEGKPGAAALVREWLSDGDGGYSIEGAREKALASADEDAA